MHLVAYPTPARAPMSGWGWDPYAHAAQVRAVLVDQLRSRLERELRESGPERGLANEADLIKELDSLSNEHRRR